MSVRPTATAQLTLVDAAPPQPPYEVGDFAYTSYQKHDLLWCPLCHFDPRRSPYRFGHGESREAHFHEAHGPEDVGRPMAELLPGGGR